MPSFYNNSIGTKWPWKAFGFAHTPWYTASRQSVGVRKLLPIGLNVHSNLLRLSRDGGKWGDGYLCPTTYTLHCHHQNDTRFKAGSCVRHFKVSLIVWAKSQDNTHKPQFFKRVESRGGSNRGPSAYQPSALPLDHTGSQSGNHGVMANKCQEKERKKKEKRKKKASGQTDRCHCACLQWQLTAETVVSVFTYSDDMLDEARWRPVLRVALRPRSVCRLTRRLFVF